MNYNCSKPGFLVAEQEINIKLYQSTDSFVLSPQPLVAQHNFRKTKLYTDVEATHSLIHGIQFLLDSQGAKALSDASKKYAGIIINNQLLMVPGVHGKTDKGIFSIVRPDLSEKEIEAFEEAINPKKKH